MSDPVTARGLRAMVMTAAVAVASVLTVSPTQGEQRTFKVTAPSCYDGAGQVMSDPSVIGSYKVVRKWLLMQQRGGPTNVIDSICEHWTNVWTMYVLVPGPTPEEASWDWYRSSEGCPRR